MKLKTRAITRKQSDLLAERLDTLANMLQEAAGELTGLVRQLREDEAAKNYRGENREDE